MINSITTTDLETATLTQLLGIATLSMREEAEAVATAAMAKIFNPVCGAREIVIAIHLRKRLSAERKGHTKFLAFLKK